MKEDDRGCGRRRRIGPGRLTRKRKVKAVGSSERSEVKARRRRRRRCGVEGEKVSGRWRELAGKGEEAKADETVKGAVPKLPSRSGSP
jgi:hypothetical protein